MLTAFFHCFIFNVVLMREEKEPESSLTFLTFYFPRPHPVHLTLTFVEKIALYLLSMEH